MKFEKATLYDEFALPQIYVAQKLARTIKKYKQDFEDIYEIGAGSGVLTKEILGLFKFKNITLNDIYKSDYMSEFNTQIGDILEIQIPKDQSLIVSSSVFQWIENLELLRDKISLSLKNDGFLGFCTFIKGTLNELSSYTKQSLNYKTEEEILQIFGDKFDILETKTGDFELKFASLKELLTHLKQTGVNNLNGSFKLTKSTYKALESYFEGEFKLTYSFMIMICKRIEI
ncbi:biotin synthase [Campylobacter hyointestinalis]|uniref:Biotin synthase n=1 Tax=Campylobacter hyointestinalis subsp. lawsonii TaxID=91353 RepID=A0AAV6EG69_CAMHY|nr:biotin synthase [Campylobacter hyointestinalis]KAB0614171.1 biotin synthase [Campylobacter hyointestinalis subsp. lawsonii]QKF69916.1 malonyl-[acp] methyltransferase [Campylobacter hyointestinalis subsp. lawsonii]RAZ23345.1 biotin synthase [Campylobacter hyointestinalis subsp. lawsonii]RAZ29878.1 biotin synthase [Campylobacter hyointestinalis subsp. lawsonii]RAZ40007.1 biotin synthase [Campylobacter hyointestinalis subsp. lawsonii]